MGTVRVVTPRAGFSAAWRGHFPHRSTARRQQQTREHQDGSTMQCETLISSHFYNVHKVAFISDTVVYHSLEVQTSTVTK